MIRTYSKITGKHSPVFAGLRCRHVFLLLLFLCCQGAILNLKADEASQTISKFSSSTNDLIAVETNSISHFNIRGFAIEGKIPLSTNSLTSLPSKNIGTNVTQKEIANAASELLTPLFAKYTGTNVSEEELVQAAADLQKQYRDRGYPTMIISISPKQITNGIVTMNVFQGVIPQILVSGRRYLIADDGTVIPADNLSIVEVAAALGISTPSPPPGSQNTTSAKTNAPPAATNSVPKFAVTSYLITGNTLLSPETLKSIFMKHMGTNVAVGDVLNAGLELQKEYRIRGYPTVNVTIPPQKITGGQVKIRVFEGRLSDIIVAKNHYFSSNNVMRALPGLHTNVILNGPIFQAELNRANENRDRQIYPVIGPGPEAGTSELTLNVKDQLPLHAKVEFNNQSSPGTPDLRVNTSAVYDNLWQLEHSLGVQYNFSPEQYKSGNQWNSYDLPLVANYSAFYRLPLGNPEAIEDVVASQPGSFGYNEATRRFNLPPPSGQTELNLYASRATIDTGVENLSSTNLFDIPFVREVDQQTVQQGLTINQDIGFQLSQPLPQIAGIRSTFSGGLDYKTYSQVNSQTNIFTFTEWTEGPNQNLIKRISQVPEATPLTDEELNYLPLAINCNANLHDYLGPATIGLGMSANLWYSSSITYTPASTNRPSLHGQKSLQGITGSSESTGHWVVFRPSFSQQIMIHTNWPTTLRADGQWASEPLISNEQFGIGGVNSVRGYHEGEVFGDTGWHISLEQQTPPHIVGMVNGDQPLTLRASVYMDYGIAYLLDPLGPPSIGPAPDYTVTYPSRRPDSIQLWGTGFGFTASVGSHWQAQFLFSVPLIGTSDTSRYQPYFNFALTGQF
jgi:hemolysin activation/secretion protein